MMDEARTEPISALQVPAADVPAADAGELDFGPTPLLVLLTVVLARMSFFFIFGLVMVRLISNNRQGDFGFAIVLVSILALVGLVQCYPLWQVRKIGRKVVCGTTILKAQDLRWSGATRMVSRTHYGPPVVTRARLRPWLWEVVSFRNEGLPLSAGPKRFSLLLDSSFDRCTEAQSAIELACQNLAGLETAEPVASTPAVVGRSEENDSDRSIQSAWEGRQIVMTIPPIPRKIQLRRAWRELVASAVFFTLALAGSIAMHMWWAVPVFGLFATVGIWSGVSSLRRKPQRRRLWASPTELGFAVGTAPGIQIPFPQEYGRIQLESTSSYSRLIVRPNKRNFTLDERKPVTLATDTDAEMLYSVAAQLDAARFRPEEKPVRGAFEVIPLPTDPPATKTEMGN